MINSLDIIKQHLRVTSNSEDVLITDYMAAAEDEIRQYLDHDYGRLPGEDDSPQEPIPGSVKQAHKLLVGDAYENREAQVVGSARSTIQANPAVTRLLFPYRKNLGV